MDNRLQATFMPRQAPGANDAYVRPKGPPNFLMGIAFVAILLIGAAWGGLFFYKGHVISANEEKKQKIQDAIDSFEPELTKQLTVLKTRIDTGKNLITNHTAFSEFLELLSTNTVQTVQFNSLSYVTGEDNKITITLQGRSFSYNAIAFQSDVFSKVPQIKNPVFSGIQLDESGEVSFNVTAELDPTVVSFSKQFAGAGTIPLPVTVTTPATTSVATTTAGASATTTTGRPIQTNNPLR